MAEYDVDKIHEWCEVKHPIWNISSFTAVPINGLFTAVVVNVKRLLSDEDCSTVVSHTFVLMLPDFISHYHCSKQNYDDSEYPRQPENNCVISENGPLAYDTENNPVRCFLPKARNPEFYACQALIAFRAGNASTLQACCSGIRWGVSPPSVWRDQFAEAVVGSNTRAVYHLVEPPPWKRRLWSVVIYAMFKHRQSDFEQTEGFSAWFHTENHSPLFSHLALSPNQGVFFSLFYGIQMVPSHGLETD